MTECHSCGGRAEVVLCGRCQGKIHGILRELPWWLDRLTETAVGQARLDTAARRTTREPMTLHGDDSLASHIEPYPDDNEEDLYEARRARQAAALRHALATGGVHPSAAELLEKVTNMLSMWIRDICETRGVEPPALRYPKLMAVWLAERINTVAGMEGADEFLQELSERFRAIRRIVNRPVPLVPYGPCPAKSGGKRCAAPLRAVSGASTVVCERCKAEHDTADIVDRYLSGRDDQHFTREEILIVMAMRGEPISARTFRSWCTPRKLPDGTTQPPRLRPRGYRRPDGRRGIARHSDDDEPVYLLGDVRKLHQEKPQVKTTGAATRRKAAK
ncbi:hypothetical protein MSP7336_01816 [Mycobacterium shimoidei]|uniref:Uncharacterized protein n=1 Tax=Mycobacterium shimoidei TaxID=29313 RepID=A0A375YXJ8_MYCSH|nr:hypothetical protein [Mycobacterium shimoidei]SRX93577.1 hypothetical protein MSP7336_01816 [Mycobacterium shimoidei]